MQRRTFTYSAAIALGLGTITAGVFAQQAPAGGAQECKVVIYCTPVPAAQAAQKEQPRKVIIRGRERTVRGQEILIGDSGEDPGLMWRETWRMPPSPTTENPGLLSEGDARRRAIRGGGAVANPELELKVYGPTPEHLLAYDFAGLRNVWTGPSGPIVVMLRDRNNFASIPSSGRLRLYARTYGLHMLHPAVKLADGTFLVADRGVDTKGDFAWGDMTFNDARWFWLDPEKVVVMREVLQPDLSKVDEVGVVNLKPSAGHQGGGWANISTVELYTNKVPR